ncbi:hypothetical protein FUAX_14220 [Fulvitalea axinellae]|uniref:Lipocalin-like domain-containing protein n=1 Tax=Fulvitalea axinellae TaxID=1182444 RepID=A0AAU9CI94_9BACT|nr:hypothetical protein FUAX_14220 [Fulvitalea axinellae]
MTKKKMRVALSVVFYAVVGLFACSTEDVSVNLPHSAKHIEHMLFRHNEEKDKAGKVTRTHKKWKLIYKSEGGKEVALNDCEKKETVEVMLQLDEEGKLYYPIWRPVAGDGCGESSGIASWKLVTVTGFDDVITGYNLRLKFTPTDSVDFKIDNIRPCELRLSRKGSRGNQPLELIYEADETFCL